MTAATNDNRPYSILPTYHAVRIELTRYAAEARNDRAALAAGRAAFLAQWRR